MVIFMSDWDLIALHKNMGKKHNKAKFNDDNTHI